MQNINLTSFDGQMIKETTEHVLLAYCKQTPSERVGITNDLCEEIINSWKGCLSVVPSDALSERSRENSLRQPQISALFEILAHLTGHQQNDATVVMPTGTGKTETMLAAVCCLPVRRALVIVPTDSLRQQTFKKFLTLGKLRELTAIKKTTLNPVVALIEGGINTDGELASVLNANVIVTTPQSMSQATHRLRSALYEACTHLFVDEAHHVKASTWDSIKKAFKNKPVIQFTATPFREDRQKVGGQIIYNYPMSMAQERGHFRPITFKSIYEVSDEVGDQRIAEEAVKQLRIDLKNGYDHILMARCATKSRATAIFKIYENQYPDLNPILIHSGVNTKNKKLEAIVRRQHRIIVCVNMLGEGFDLPELKVCALHDVHKSLAITLQFAGRFVRDRTDLGNPTFIANVCDQRVADVLKELYLEDPDWNKVLKRTSETSIQRELEMQQIVDGAIKAGVEVPLENLNPTLSALVYHVSSAKLNMDIENIPLDGNEKLIASIIVPNANLIILITKVDLDTKWAPQSDFSQSEWRLMILFGIQSQNLLFIHDSSKSGVRKQLAEFVCAGATLLKGDDVFKCFGDVERLVLQNAGLNKGRRGPLRYIMYTGIDIESAINDLAQGASYKSNLFGKGYELGNKVSIGCSYKGRIWSMNSASISDWMTWCRDLGRKLNDPNNDPNKILDKVLRTREISSIPQLTPIGIDWPDYFFEHGVSSIIFELKGRTYFLDEAQIEITTYSPGTITFSITIGTYIAKFQYSITTAGYSVHKIEGDDISINLRSSRRRLEEFFSLEASPSVYFADGSKIFENLHIVRPVEFTIPHFRRDLLDSRIWHIDIRKESQGEEKDKDTIQYSVIQSLLQGGYWIIFDDDGANEAADIVAFKDEGDVMAVEFYHLKYSTSGKPGSRIDDFYEVCGQVIKGCKWVGEFDNIINHLKMREKSRINRSGKSRIEKGEFRNFDSLSQHASRLRKEYRFFIVQPGLDTQNASDDVLALLGSIDLYVRETTGNALRVIGSCSGGNKPYL